MALTHKSLTKAEEQIMQVLWALDKAFLREIVEALPSPKPHQNTVATILKILGDKAFVGKEVFSRTHQYYPLVSKESYSASSIRNLVKRYFGGSFTNVISSMVKEKNLSLEELEMLLKELKKHNKN
ncbi:MAG: BlaI/MecI/CopY family transcriptional regulator [Chitinophagaceae bacterium]|nr:BlaI/MecI/CopY family transcriptional regulator [Chitinophagaceae bacterium]